MLKIMIISISTFSDIHYAFVVRLQKFFSSSYLETQSAPHIYSSTFTNSIRVKILKEKKSATVLFTYFSCQYFLNNPIQQLFMQHSLSAR